MKTAKSQTEQKLRRILDNCSDLVHYCLDLETNEFDYISPSSLTILGFTPEQVQAMGIAGFEQRIQALPNNA